MDREEAIKILKDTLYDEKTPTDYLEAVKMGREALENQTSVIAELEKIKAEIYELKGFNEACCGGSDLGEAIKIIKDRIAELKEK